MSSDKTEIFRSAYEEYKKTYERQLETQSSVNSKAIEIIKIDLLLGSVAATIITFSPSFVDIPYFLIGSISLVFSITYCVTVFSPTNEYDVGTAESAFEDMKTASNLETHYEDLAKSYKNSVGNFDEKYEEEKADFERAIWFATSTVLLYLTGAGSTLWSYSTGFRTPIHIDFVVILLVGILTMYIREKAMGKLEYAS
ncbi:hypothetical protein [Haloarcula montana]|uniref:hypothetical protein n=1 Tax=Haloarcula montana TaxID=3111776 RepID=UPI002D791B47|nr:hypothetical protein [Haloarcula sp. GH36]